MSLGVRIELEVRKQSLVHTSQNFNDELVFQDLHELSYVLLTVEIASLAILHVLFCIHDVVL